MQFHLIETNQDSAGPAPAAAGAGRIWARTPLTAAAFVALGWVIVQLPLHPFMVLAGLVLLPPAISLITPLVLPARIASPLNWLLYGSGFALIGGILEWWVYFRCNDPVQQNKLELALAIGFFALALLAVGSSIVTAVVSGPFRRLPHCCNNTDTSPLS